MISVSHLRKRFGRIRAVDGVSFEVGTGEAVALWGANGAGKTTIIRCVLGVVRFDGRISVGGHDVLRRGKSARHLLGYVPQELAFHDEMRAGAAIRLVASLRATPLADAMTALERVGLEGCAGRRVRELSGGMKQRLALALALLADPPAILLDEPTSNLDRSGRDDVVRMLVELKRAGKTVLFASHRPEEVAALADRVLVLERGRIVDNRSPDRLGAAGPSFRTMRLRVPHAQNDAAATALRAEGLPVENNGHGLCVNVAHGAKAGPIRILVGAGIDVDDFELLPLSDAHDQEILP
ncbi:MAG: ABC transporter ATP-binding protein [Phycisphaerales bacterium]|nr:ABC transporter ATP-binding protein [Phycisphaerales bacterium]